MTLTLQLVGLAACLIGAVRVVACWERIAAFVRPMLLLLLGVGALRFGLTAYEYHLGEELLGVDVYSDAIGAIWPLSWFFLFYGLILDAHRRSYARRNRELDVALQELRQMQDCVLRDERLRVTGELAAGVAHDFNNRLTTILSSAELLSVSGLDPENRELAEGIVRSAEQAGQVVQRLRDFHSSEQGVAFEWIEGRGLLEHCAELTRPHWGKADRGIAVTVEAGGDTDFVGSELELTTALSNMVLNAVDALPEGGRITLRARTSDAGVVLSVIDNGVGMEASICTRAAEPFFSTKGQGRACGLGLTMARNVAEGHGGRLELESVEGRGTTARLILPVVDLARQVPPLVEVEPVPRGLHVMVVDDSPDVQRVLSKILEADGQEVIEARNAASAYERLVSGQVDAVLLDNTLPDAEGDEVARQIKDISPDTPVLLLARRGDRVDDDGFLPPGVDAALVKPVGRSSLQRTLATVCRRRS